MAAFGENRVPIIIEVLLKNAAKARQQFTGFLTELDTVQSKTFKNMAKNLGYDIKKNRAFQQGVKGSVAMEQVKEDVAKAGAGVAVKTIKNMQAQQNQAKALTMETEAQKSAQYGFWKVLKMTQDQYVYNTESGVVYQKATGKLADKIRFFTHGLRGFRMELLSVMFGAMNVARGLETLLKPAMAVVGIQQLWNDALEDVFLPVMDAIMPIVETFTDFLSDLGDGAKMVIGVFVLLGLILMKSLFSIAQFSLFTGGLITSLGTLTKALTTNSVALAGNAVASGVASKGQAMLIPPTLAEAGAMTKEGTAGFFAASGLWAMISAAAVATAPFAAFAAVILAIGVAIWQLIEHWKSITKWFKDMYNRIKDALDIGDLWGKMWEYVTNVAITAWDGLTGAWESFWQGFLDIWKIVASWIWDKILKPMLSIFGTGFIVLFGKLQGIFENWSLSWKLVWDYVKLVAFNVWNGIVTGIETFVNGIIKGINWLTNGISKFAKFFGVNLGDLQISEIDLSGIKIDTEPLKQEIASIKEAMRTNTERTNEEINQQVSAWNGWLDNISNSLKGIDEPANSANETISSMQTTADTATTSITTAFSTMTTNITSGESTFTTSVGNMTTAIEKLGTAGETAKEAIKGIDLVQQAIQKTVGSGYIVGVGQVLNEQQIPSPLIGAGAGTAAGLNAGMNINFNPNTTINATISKEVDIDRVKDKLSREWVDELRELIRSGRI